MTLYLGDCLFHHVTVPGVAASLQLPEEVLSRQKQAVALTVALLLGRRELRPRSKSRG